MKKVLKAFLLFIVFAISFFSVGNIVFAEPIGSDWVKFDEKYNVALDKKWSIDFTQEASLDKIDGIVIEKDNQFIPSKIEVTGEKQITITPVSNYESNSKYCLKIFLNNKKRYYMYFNTVSEQINYLENDIKYMNYQESSNDAGFCVYYNSKKLASNSADWVYWTNPGTDNVGNSYENSLLLAGTYASGYNFIEYPLLGKYKKLKATIGIEKSEQNVPGVSHLRIYSDKSIIYDREFKAGDFPENIDLDLEGASKLKFELSSDSIYSHCVGIYDPKLILK